MDVEDVVTMKFSLVSIALIMLSEVIGLGVACHSACLCYVDDNGLRTANCTGVKFISENKQVFNEIGVLNIQTDNDEPITLRDDMFISFTKLKFLNLQNCRINYLPKNVFKGLKKVLEINLSSNDIKHFDNGVFENIYSLNKLNLRGNRLQGSTKPFISSSSLRELDLGYCGMTNIQNEFFHGVKRLTRLYLDGNHLQTIKEHILPTRITHLNLANNRIINVPISTISSLSQLRWLDLKANPINCTCALMNLQDILSGHATLIDGDLICAYPTELENISLSKVNENEVCSKETFNSRYHFKKSQTTKYASYSKKERYFENEKYNPFEIQGDDPGTSADEYDSLYSPKEPVQKLFDENKGTVDEYDSLYSSKEPDQKLFDENKGTVVETNNTALESGPIKHEPLIENKNDVAKVVEQETQNNTDENAPQEFYNNTDTDVPDGNGTDIVNVDDGKSKTLEDTSLKIEDNYENKSAVEDDGNLKYGSNEDALNIGITLPPEDYNKSAVEKDGNVEYGSNDDALTVGITLPPEDYNIDIPVDVNSKKSGTEMFDESMKFDEVMPIGDLPHNELTSTEKVKISTNNINKEEIRFNDDTDKHKNESSNNGDDKIIPAIIMKSDNDTNENNERQGKLDATDLLEVEGSGTGSEEFTTPNTSFPLVKGDELPDHIVTDVSEEPVRINEIYPVETDDNEKSTTDENDNIRQIVDKQPLIYEEMGPIIVVACIIIFILILGFIAVYKCLRKSKETNRKPIRDVEASNGTELHDITSSLLPKSPVNDEKHNNKYPNELPSPETISLIKEDKTDEMNEQNHKHDHNQNDNKNDLIVTNGKTMESSPPPIEKTTAKLTVLHESIPKTPIFLHKD